MAQPMNLSGGASSMGPTEGEGSVSGSVPGDGSEQMTKQGPGQVPGQTPGAPAPLPLTEDQLSSAVQEGEVSELAEAFDIEFSKTLKKQSNTIANGEPYVIPPSAETETTNTDANNLENEMKTNPWFDTHVYLALFQNMQEASRQMSHASLIESGYVIKGLEAEWDLGESIAGRIMSRSGKEMWKHITLAVVSGASIGLAGMQGYNNTRAGNKAQQEFDAEYGQLGQDGKWAGGTRENKVQTLDGDIAALKKEINTGTKIEPIIAGDSPDTNKVPIELTADEISARRQELKDKEIELNAETETLKKGRANKGDTIDSRKQQIMNEKGWSMFSPMTSHIWKIATDTMQSVVQASFSVPIAMDEAAQQTLQSAQKINNQLLQSSLDARTSATREVNEIQQALRQILSNLHHTFGTFAQRRS